MEVLATGAQMELANIQSANAATAAPTTTFDKQGFLKLLVAQLEHQDPMNPTSNEQFMSQMTQFSMMEELQNMGTSLAGYTRSNMITSAANLVGKEVTLEDVAGEQTTGVVDSIRYVNDDIELSVNGQWRPMTDLTGVSQTPSQPETL